MPRRTTAGAAVEHGHFTGHDVAEMLPVRCGGARGRGLSAGRWGGPAEPARPFGLGVNLLHGLHHPGRLAGLGRGGAGAPTRVIRSSKGRTCRRPRAPRRSGVPTGCGSRPTASAFSAFALLAVTRSRAANAARCCSTQASKNDLGRGESFSSAASLLPQRKQDLTSRRTKDGKADRRKRHESCPGTTMPRVSASRI